jgi:hypothetical protein
MVHELKVRDLPPIQTWPVHLEAVWIDEVLCFQIQRQFFRFELLILDWFFILDHL